jgi:hypothetical protein
MTEYEWRRRFSEWRTQHFTPGDFQILEVGKSTAADNRYKFHIRYA